ncbi:hypothetical protein AABE10_23510 [Paraburkholderia diazotrophica]
MCTFDNPTDFSKAATVRMAAPRNAGGDVALVQDASVFRVVVRNFGHFANEAAGKLLYRSLNQTCGTPAWLSNKTSSF